MIRSFLCSAVLCLVTAATLAVPAYAQEAAPPSTTLDLGPIVVQALAFLAPTILTIASFIGIWVLARLATWLGLKVDSRHRATIEQGLLRAVQFALERVGNRALGGIPVNMQSAAIVAAAEYARNRIPDALAYFKITDVALAEMVEARLEGLVVDPEVQPAGQRLGRVMEPAVV